MKFFIDDGYVSLNHVGEELCGDKVEIVRKEDATTIVLADGLGSGVKANILATLTSKLLSIMIASDADIEECIASVISTLPVCKVRKVAYSTFTVIHVDNNGKGYIFEFDNPPLIYIRDGKLFNLQREKKVIIDKTVYCSIVDAKVDDCIVFCSDGAPHAGIGKTMNLGWSINDIASYILSNYSNEMSARQIAALVGEACNSLYMGEPGDDTTIAALKFMTPLAVNILVGPPIEEKDDDEVVKYFLAQDGLKVVCGGTTSKIVARYLKEDIKPSLTYYSKDVPPIAIIKGIDLVTEGVITLGKVLEVTEKYLDTKSVEDKSLNEKDGATLIANLILKRASNVNLFVGTTLNPAHKDLPIDVSMKMKIVESLKKSLESAGKIVRIEYH